MLQYAIAEFGNKSVIFRSSSSCWELLHLEGVEEDEFQLSASELDDLVQYCNQLEVVGEAEDASHNLPLKDPFQLLANVTFTRISGKVSNLKKLSPRDLLHIEQLCDRVACTKAVDPGALCFREVSSSRKVTFNDGGVERDVVIVKVESKNQERFRLHAKYARALYSKGLGPQLYHCEQTPSGAQLFFTEKLSLCTTLEQLLEQLKRGEHIDPAVLDRCSRSLLDFSQFMVGSGLFFYRGKSYIRFLQEILVDVGTGCSYFWCSQNVIVHSGKNQTLTVSLGHNDTHTVSPCQWSLTARLLRFTSQALDALQHGG